MRPLYTTYYSFNEIPFYRPRTQLIKPQPQRQQQQPQRQLFNSAARQPQQQQFRPASPANQQFSQSSSQQFRQPTRQTAVDTEIFPGLTGNAPRDEVTQNAALNVANFAVNTQNGGVVI